MKHIPLSRGMFAIVDDEDFEWLNQWKWSALKVKSAGGHRFYAVRVQRKAECCGEKPKMILMHRVLASAEGRTYTDHQDNCGLNNQRHNLRPCSQAENSLNHKGHYDRASRFKGVYLHKQSKKWVSEFRGKHLGSFDSDEQAAAAYDRAAIAHNQDFSLTNADMGIVQ